MFGALPTVRVLNDSIEREVGSDDNLPISWLSYNRLVCIATDVDTVTSYSAFGWPWPEVISSRRLSLM